MRHYLPSEIEWWRQQAAKARKRGRRLTCGDPMCPDPYCMEPEYEEDDRGR